MSGLQVYDPELKTLGLTLPGLLERGQAIASLPSLALLTLAAMTPNEHQVEYLEVPDITQLHNVPDQYDLVAISSYSAQIHEAYQLAQIYKGKGIKTIIGGPHVTCVPDEAAQQCDAVAIGEGEIFWRDMIDDAANQRLQPRYGKRFDNFDLNYSVTPSFELIEHLNHSRILVETSRGCPHLCEFCAASPLLTKKFRQKPIENVLREIDVINSLWKRPFIEFADDNAFINKQYWMELLPQLRKRNVRWFAESDVSIGSQLELLDMMSKSGCKQLLIGLESPSATSLDGIETKHNWKWNSWKLYKDAVRNIQSRGIRVTGCFVLGLDGQKANVFDEVADFAEELQLYDIQITVQTAFPGTPLYNRLKAGDRLLEPENWRACTLFDVNFQPTDMTIDELRKGFRELGESLYSDMRSEKRRETFKELWKQAYRDTRSVSGGVSARH